MLPSGCGSRGCCTLLALHPSCKRKEGQLPPDLPPPGTSGREGAPPASPCLRRSGVNKRGPPRPRTDSPASPGADSGGPQLPAGGGRRAALFTGGASGGLLPDRSPHRNGGGQTGSSTTRRTPHPHKGLLPNPAPAPGNGRSGPAHLRPATDPAAASPLSGRAAKQHPL